MRLIFYARMFGRETECQTLVKLIDILTDNIYHLEILKFSHPWHNDLPEVFDTTCIFQYARNIHRYNTRYAAKQNFYKYKLQLIQESNHFLTWQDLPSSLKDLSVFAFPKSVKHYLLSEQET